jgi:O-antigen/teichoic acid export membrane protein
MRRLSRNVAANAVTVAATLATALVSVPLIIGHVGLSGYGIWTVALTAIVYVTTAESGVGPAIQRFTALAHGGADLQAAARLLWSTLVLYLVLGIVFAVLALALAPTLVHVFDVAPHLRGDARAMFRITGIVGLLALLAVGMGNTQQGLERFPAYAASGAIGALVFLGGIVIALKTGAGLSGLAWAAVAQQATIGAVRAWGVRDVMRLGAGVVTRGQAREIGGFSLRVSMTAISLIVNFQTDKVVVGVLASGPELGQLGIGGQVAEAGRLVVGSALSPIVSRMAAIHGRGEPGELERLFERLHRVWTVTVLGLMAVGGGALYPLIATWLGAGHGRAAVFGSFLVVAYGLNLMTGPGVAYLRAVGRPGVEARLGAITIAANVGMTVGLGIAFGALGVVAATLGAFLVGTAWFFVRLRRDTGLPTPPPGAAAFAMAGAAAAFAFGWGVGCNQLLGRWAGLVPVGAGTVVAFVAYLSFATGVRPTVANLRALLG